MTLAYYRETLKENAKKLASKGKGILAVDESTGTGLRLVMVWLRTHSHKVQLRDLEHSHVTQTVTTEELRFLTLCNINISFEITETPSGVSFFVKIR